MSVISASKQTLAIYKNKLKAANLGHDLLETKRDNLKKRFREIMVKLVNVNTNIFFN